MNASSQKLRKLSILSSFSSDLSDESQEFSSEELITMVDQLYDTLIRSRLLPKSYQRPEPCIKNLNFLINTLCDEFLLEIDKPIFTTNCTLSSSYSKEEIQGGDSPEDTPMDLLSKIFQPKNEIFLTEKDCKDISALIIDGARCSKSSTLKKHKEKLENKLIGYGEELMKNKRLVKAKEVEILRLQKEIEDLTEARDFSGTPISESMRESLFEKDLEDTTEY